MLQVLKGRNEIKFCSSFMFNPFKTVGYSGAGFGKVQPK